MPCSHEKNDATLELAFPTPRNEHANDNVKVELRRN
jgi:hypothetical protein